MSVYDDEDTRHKSNCIFCVCLAQTSKTISKWLTSFFHFHLVSLTFPVSCYVGNEAKWMRPNSSSSTQSQNRVKLVTRDRFEAAMMMEMMMNQPTNGWNVNVSANEKKWKKENEWTKYFERVQHYPLFQIASIVIFRLLMCVCVLVLKHGITIHSIPNESFTIVGITNKNVPFLFWLFRLLYF